MFSFFLALMASSPTYDSLRVLSAVATPIGAISQVLTYVPQMVTTFRLKRKASLSIITLGVQVHFV